MDTKVNSQKYWDDRFSGNDWENNNGCQQTLYFYSLMLQMMPQWLKFNIKTKEVEKIDNYNIKR